LDLLAEGFPGPGAGGAIKGIGHRVSPVITSIVVNGSLRY
jgi:hypothetical protein